MQRKTASPVLERTRQAGRQQRAVASVSDPAGERARGCAAAAQPATALKSATCLHAADVPSATRAEAAQAHDEDMPQHFPAPAAPFEKIDSWKCVARLEVRGAGRRRERVARGANAERSSNMCSNAELALGCLTWLLSFQKLVC